MKNARWDNNFVYHVFYTYIYIYIFFFYVCVCVFVFVCCLDVVVGRGGYRGVLLTRGGGLPSPRGMLRGTATGVPMIGGGNPAKITQTWGGRNARQTVYGRPVFVRG